MFRNWTDSVGQVNHQLIVCIFFGFYFLLYFFFRVFRLWTYYIGYQFTSLNTQHLGSLFTKKNISDHFLLQNLNCLNVKRDIYSATFLIRQSITLSLCSTRKMVSHKSWITNILYYSLSYLSNWFLLTKQWHSENIKMQIFQRGPKRDSDLSKLEKSASHIYAFFSALPYNIIHRCVWILLKIMWGFNHQFQTCNIVNELKEKSYPIIYFFKLLYAYLWVLCLRM